MVPTIHADHEVIDVLNAFPSLKNSFQRLHLPLKGIEDGVTLDSYLDRSTHSPSEKAFFLKQLNRDLNRFLESSGEPAVSEVETSLSPFIEVSQEEE